MQEPVIATALLIALTGWCAVHCALAAAGRGCPDRRLEPIEFVTALAMVAMVAPAADPLPRVLWAALLAAVTAWPALLLAGRMGRHHRSAPIGALRHYPHHILSAAVMAALVLLMAPAQHHAGTGHTGGGHGGGHAAVPEWVLLALVAYFLVHAARGAGTLLPRPAAGGRPRAERPAGRPAGRPARVHGPAALTSPDLVAARRTVMSIGMAYMLLGMS
ncbi:DUF5134 domain-containing protein [Kitasatospora sp. NPDC005748]|uniref:DUF5134 domain-containing protein n=1 Tax=Kitasatospora sp. NPDC005748 TaxID=3157063 RepID=UPI003406D7B1